MTADVWSRLVSTALVGTERKPPPPEAVELAARVVGTEVGADSDELRVLLAGAVLGSWRRAGLATAATHEPVPPSSEDDVVPEAPTGASHLLELLLDGQVDVVGGPLRLVGAWLRRAGATGHRPPSRLLPRLLAAASTAPELRAPLIAAGGPRLTWLAARNPAWGWATEAAEPSEEAWWTGGRERFEVLAAIRSTDPDRARWLVERTWSGEKAADRARIVTALADRLGPADEPFLEAALDDRSGAVRIAAARLLSALPGAALGERMAARLDALVTPRRLGKVDVALPDEPDAAARRDGISDADAPPGVGRRAWWLRQMVAATPLSWWEARLDRSPAAIASKVPADVHEGLVLATIRQRDVRWSAGLLEVRPDAALLDVLPPDAAVPTLARLLASASDTAVPGLLLAVPGPWPPSLTGSVVDRLRRARALTVVDSSLPAVAAAAGPAAIALLERWIAELGDREPGRQRSLRSAAHALSLRHAIDQELP